MLAEQRISELNDQAVAELLDAHRKRSDEPLVLAVRFNQADSEIYLLEVLDGFPGGDDDELMEMEFEPSANLMILGRLHLVLGSPGQLEAAVERGDEIVGAIRGGEVIHNDGEVANALKNKLGFR